MQTFTCDGCGEPIAEPVKVGHFVFRDYCAPCAETAEHFLAAEESLRRELVESFKVNRDILISKFSVDLTLLPDTP